MNPRMTEISFFRGVFDMFLCIGGRSAIGPGDPWGIEASHQAVQTVGSARFF
jgi:hypothetical protein